MKKDYRNTVGLAMYLSYHVDNKVTVSGPEGKVTCAKDDHNVYVITVQNEVIYELPSTGGSGIYWYSICGMLLMMAADRTIYKNKCREVLVK